MNQAPTQKYNPYNDVMFPTTMSCCCSWQEGVEADQYFVG